MSGEIAESGLPSVRVAGVTTGSLRRAFRAVRGKLVLPRNGANAVRHTVAASPDRGCGCASLLMAALVLTPLSACTTPPPITACPPDVPYTAEQQARAADELAALPQDAALRAMMADYKRTRDQLRVCAQ